MNEYESMKSYLFIVSIISCFYQTYCNVYNHYSYLNSYINQIHTFIVLYFVDVLICLFVDSLDLYHIHILHYHKQHLLMFHHNNFLLSFRNTTFSLENTSLNITTGKWRVNLP
ncbi:hypothetical protein EDI_255110 [Entamoeba dispar SAW760]|uniref:Uncharacterized protein n=1 Tax=Entamoeba dispar (strain ATCC PRA-260 / SAW760) TaxID=370354 RepID=B0EQG4_ENTDS|nr:uncharacterized protein EDI_255110 [Entamoeba dispar SAW760]EDR23219.1 hypothetical protein EDI_255110 [Entamoeba dispar SAW760]|eukprot:EDR23219.1 hypothetical protein EDI_255110 [Entamoeba dispar SAW760]